MSKRTFTEEEKKKLLGLLPISQESGIPYKPKVYKGEMAKFAPTFYIRSWTVDEHSGFVADVQGEGKDFNKVIYNHALKAIVNITDLYNIEGEEIDFKADTKKAFESLPFMVVMDVFNEIKLISGLREADAEGLE
jgi:hypothetical protein